MRFASCCCRKPQALVGTTVALAAARLVQRAEPRLGDIAKVLRPWQPYVLVTGIPALTSSLTTSWATPLTVLYSEKFERFEAVFCAGVSVGCSLTALLANGTTCRQPPPVA
jgi:hypothetical protein